MDIQDTKVGQAFASPITISTSVQNQVKLDSSVKTNDSGSQAESNARQANTALSSDSAEKARQDKLNISQGSVDNADKNAEERKGIALDDAVAKVDSFLKAQNRDLAFTIDENTNRSVVTVKDATSGDVIRQIPSEEVLKLAERIQELQQDVGDSVGVFINNQV
ncbi:flagellar biosynthesis protein FlaG [Alteromonas sp. V450]|uniref:flagellar protein FlaG n=1 Tax=Alteromonas sp. V450 TaxID=1912139 RepID=UPI0008FF06D4|nr:flagellar protein FlaG [Alteromonas sp. V450]OJF67341.1 flagellar biosynthesis protein FlaG [Alteromonas sp. V450]